MSDFTKCITKTLRYEGVSSSSEGYVDHPNDRGGATKYGISYAFRAFLKGITIRPNTSYTSVDHSVFDSNNITKKHYRY